MPVPAGDLNSGPLRLKFESQKSSCHCIEQHQQSSGQMHGVSSSQQIKVVAAGVCCQKHALKLQVLPDEDLAGKEAEPKHNRHSQPQPIALYAGGNNSHSTELFFLSLAA